MSIFRFSCAFLFASFLVAGDGVKAEAPAPVVQSELAPAVALSHRVEHLKKAFLSGREASVQAAIQDVELLRRTYGTLDVTPLVEAMTLWARQRGEEGNADLGLQVVQTLERWAPRKPLLLGTRIILMRQQGIKGYLLSMPDVVELTKLRLASPQHRWLWIVQHVAWLRLMAAVLLWGWALVLALRYRKVFRDLWESYLFRHMSTVPATVIGAVIISFPVILGLDPSVAAIFWLWLLTPFLYRVEVRISLLVVLVQLVHPALALMEPEAIVMAPPSITAMQLQPSIRSMEQQGIRRLPPLDQEFLKGWRLLQAQDWAGAETVFDGLSVKHPDRFAVLNNRGVARFQQSKVDESKADFEQAAAAAGRPVPEILLNQSVIAFRQLDSVTGSAKEEEARQAAPDEVLRLMNANQARADVRTFPSPLPETPERQAALIPVSEKKDALFSGRLGNKDILIGLLLPLIALGAMLLRLARSMKQAHPTQCTRCGEPFHTTDSPDVEVCSKCHHLFLLKDGLHGESRKKKVEEVASFQKTQSWIHRVLIVIAPGLDLCFLGEAGEGFLEFSFLCFALGIALATGRSVRFPAELLADPASIWLPIGLVLLVVLFLRSWLKLLPRRHS